MTLQSFLDKSLQSVFSNEGRQLQIAALKGLNSALKVPDPPASVSAILFQKVTEMFEALKQSTDVRVCMI